MLALKGVAARMNGECASLYDAKGKVSKSNYASYAAQNIDSEEVAAVPTTLDLNDWV